MKLLLDGDLFCYRCAASAENSTSQQAILNLERLLDDVILALSADTFQFYLSGNTNFRYQVYPEYKANRLEAKKPTHLPVLREYLLNYGAILSENCEADDLMGIAQCEADYGSTTIVSLDKDMLMIPGWHYSWYIEGGTPEARWSRPAKLQEVSYIQGLHHFYTQLIVGDISDNIKGIPNVGKVGAKKLLDGLTTEEEMFNAVRDAYSCDEAMLMNGKCLWIMREKEKQWEFPFESNHSGE